MDSEESVGRRPRRQRQTKTTKIDVPDAARTPKADYWEEPSRELVLQIAHYVAETVHAHLHPAVTYQPVIKGSPIKFLEMFDLAENLATDEDKWCLCAACGHDHPKFKRNGVICWFPEDGTIKIVGRDCYKSLDPENFEKADAQYRRDVAERKDESYLLKRLPQVPVLLTDIDNDIAVAAAIIDLRARLGAAMQTPRVSELVDHVKNGELYVDTGAKSSTGQGVRALYARIEGTSLLTRGYPAVRDLRQAKAALMRLDWGDELPSRLANLSLKQKAEAASLFGNAWETWRTARGVIEDMQLFLSPVTGKTLETWSARPDATLSFYFSYADDEFKLGLSPTRCETVAIPMAARERLASLPTLVPTRLN